MIERILRDLEKIPDWQKLTNEQKKTLKHVCLLGSLSATNLICIGKITPEALYFNLVDYFREKENS